MTKQSVGERMPGMMPFEEAPEFVEWDNRKDREKSPVSMEQMHNKHAVLFPEGVVRGKSVLDLWCAMGATGHWCLSHGATNYRGVEAQKTFADKAMELLERYHPGKASIEHVSIEEYLDSASAPSDMVSILGVLYVFVDYYSILKKVCALAKETVVIESLYPYGPDFKPYFIGVQFTDVQDINLADKNASLYGRGTRLSPKGLEFVMKDFGFESMEGQLYPKAITSSLDVYNNMDVPGPRYLLRFQRTGNAHVALTHDLTHERSGTEVPWQKYEK